MDSKDIRALFEAYTAVYDENLRDEIELNSIDEDLSFIDDLSDNELVQVMEEILFESEVTLDECFDAFDFELLSEESEMERMNRLQNKATRERKSAAATAKRMKSAERERVGRKHAVKRLEVATTRAARNIAGKAKTAAAGAASASAGGATEVGRKAKEGAQKVGGKLAAAKERIKGFVKKVGRAAKAGYSAAKKEFSGEAGKEAQARTTGRQMRRAARNQAAAERAKDTSEFQKKPSKKPSDPWAGSATKPPSKSSATTKTTRALSGSSTKGALPPAKESDRKQAAKAKLAKAAAGSSAKGIRFAGKTSGQVASQRARTGLQGALDKFRKKAGISEELFYNILNSIFEDMIAERYVETHDEALLALESFSYDDMSQIIESYIDEQVETIDLYDVVMNYLLDEGYAETEENAEVIMVNMSEEWRNEIIESTHSYSAKKARAGKDIGKKGKMFSKIAAEAGKRYGSEERGKKVAGSILAKLRKG